MTREQASRRDKQKKPHNSVGAWTNVCKQQIDMDKPLQDYKIAWNSASKRHPFSPHPVWHDCINILANVVSGCLAACDWIHTLVL